MISEENNEESITVYTPEEVAAIANPISSISALTPEQIAAIAELLTPE